MLHDTAPNGLVADLERALARRASDGASGRTTARPLARGDGWSVEDVICTSGPADRPFEERHSQFSIAIVAAGTFQYRSTAGHALMTPGSMLLATTANASSAGTSMSRRPVHRVSLCPESFEQISVDAACGKTIRFSRRAASRARSARSSRRPAQPERVTGVSWKTWLKLAARVTRLLGVGLSDRTDMPRAPSPA